MAEGGCKVKLYINIELVVAMVGGGAARCAVCPASVLIDREFVGQSINETTQAAWCVSSRGARHRTYTTVAEEYTGTETVQRFLLFVAIL